MRIPAPVWLALLTPPACAWQAGAPLSPEVWKTDLSKRSIDLSELHAGKDRPPKDSIPSIDLPEFDPVAAAAGWLAPGEPVIVVDLHGETRAYPLQILLWHELVNDRIGETPILVSYCPLCNSALVFDRRVKGQAHTFGVASFLRHNDMVMYDRQTDTLWQQLTGEAIVGTLTGEILTPLPSRLAPFGQFAAAHPEGRVLNRRTGMLPPYGESTYTGYEFGDAPRTAGAKPMRQGERFERVFVVSAEGARRAYTLDFLRRLRVVEDRLKSVRYVVFHEAEMLTLLDAPKIADSRSVGTAAAYHAEFEGRRLRFRSRKGRIEDRETGSTWNLMGVAVDGPLKGARLTPVNQGLYFEFAYRTFYPRQAIVGRPLQNP